MVHPVFKPTWYPNKCPAWEAGQAEKRVHVGSAMRCLVEAKRSWAAQPCAIKVLPAGVYAVANRLAEFPTMAYPL